MNAARQAWDRVPLPALIALVLVLVGGAVDYARAGGERPARRHDRTLAAVARAAGCRLQELDHGRPTNPPVTGRRVERTIAADGSHIGRRPPSVNATIHALLHGRVLVQYRPGLPGAQVQALDRFVREDPRSVVGFQNQTGMSAPVAATAYLSLLTCPRVNYRTLAALRAFRDRRRDFGNAY
jgi:hypothetical protein